jgi:alpha-N-arabinofuranosidase
MLLTPTYHVFRMYVPFQDARSVPVKLDAGRWSQGTLSLPRLDAIAAKDTSGRLLLAVTNLDPARQAAIDVSVDGASLQSVSAETLSGEKVDSINTFESPQAVAPKPLAATLDAGRLRATVPAKSVTVFTLSP